MALRHHVAEGKSRADDDIEAFEAAKILNPVPPYNHRGEPQWNGSKAQEQLLIDMENEEHFKVTPKTLWESRDMHQEFELKTFRDHIHQIWQTQKCLHTLKERSKKKQQDRIDEAKKRKQTQIDRVKKAEEKKKKDHEKKKLKA